MKPFALSTPAVEELGSAVLWYETRRSGLGGEFYDAVTRTIVRIRPTLRLARHAARRFPHRRLQVVGFPYTIVYRVREHYIYVVAVAHASRRPDYWKDRS